MNPINTTAVLAAAYLAVFFEARYSGFCNLLGAQIDLLPALMVYASLSSGLATVTLLAVCGGLWFDALSANPPGVTVLPLFLIGFTIHGQRELILRDQAYAQFVLGLMASAAAPLLTLGMLLLAGEKPLVGWSLGGRWLIVTAEGALCTPALFWLFDRFNHAFNYQKRVDPAFRPDREIKRGRA